MADEQAAALFEDPILLNVDQLTHVHVRVDACEMRTPGRS